jgi:hypothetical protein
MDKHDFEPDDEGFRTLLLVTDRWSGYAFDLYLKDHTALSIIEALTYLINHLKYQHSIDVKVIECDNEFTDIKPEVARTLSKRNIRLEPSAPYTQSQNGAAERLGGVIKNKIRAMRISSNLPAKLWREVTHAAVYLYNRTPRYYYNWSTPYERFHMILALRNGLQVKERKPQQAHLRVYGCKAYAATSTYLAKKERLKRLHPRNWIGYLVGYDSTNIYRVWNPKSNRVVRTRDVIFDEDCIFPGSIEQLKDELRDIKLDDLQQLLNRVDMPPQCLPTEEEAEADREDDSPTFMLTHQPDEEVHIMTEPEAVDTASRALQLTEEMERLEQEAYPTPHPTPPASCLAGAITREGQVESQPQSSQSQPWNAAFAAGLLAGKLNVGPTRASAIRQIRKPNQSRERTKSGPFLNRDQVVKRIQSGGLVKLHRRELPPEPKSHRDLADHPLGPEFQEAEREHLQSHKITNSWSAVPKHTPDKRREVLGCMWVYVYKCDKHGRLNKLKARLVIQGD